VSALLTASFLSLPFSLAAAPVYERVAAFDAGPLHPESTLIQHTDGTFFGTTSDGGGFRLGTVFHMDASGAIVSTVEFTGNGSVNKGANPVARLIRASDGTYYGTTKSGGSGNFGTIFTYVPDGAVTTLVQFTGKTGVNKGSAPVSELMEGTDGNFYGTTFSGGADDAGTIFKMTPAGVLTTLIEFSGDGVINKGKGPAAALTQSANFLFGTTTLGGISNLGTVFQVTTTGTQFITLVNFTGNGLQNKGANPQAKLLKHTDGRFYGSTLKGGLFDRGTIFWMKANGELASMVHMSATDGALSNGSAPWELVLGADGFFYGTTRDGGLNGAGTVFRVSANGSLTTRYSFAGTDGSRPPAGLAAGSDGNFYGTTRLGGPGGTQGSGTVFKITPAGQLTALTSFTGDGATKGNGPNPGLIADGQGGMLGTTFSGGAFGVGTIFRVTPGGVVTTLIEFTGKSGANIGTNPRAGLLKHTDGNFYGTTRAGGADDNGTVFKLTPAGVLTTMVEFTGAAGLKKGSGPAAALVSGADSNLYGTTEKGGTGGFGTLFRLTPEGTFITMAEFTGVSGSKRGNAALGALVKAVDGSLFGTTSLGGDPALDDLGQPQVPNGSGTVFRMSLLGDFTSPVLFTGKTGSKPGAIPLGGLMLASDTRFYGTTSQGGANGLGTIFRLTAAGEFLTVFDFKIVDQVKGAVPNGSLVEASDGNFYGTTGTGSGSVYSFTPGGVVIPTGTAATVFEFTGSAGAFPGDKPGGPLLSFTDGHLYGTTSAGGVTAANSPAGGGQIYRLRFGSTPVTLAASGVTNTVATLNGTINPNGAATTAAFEYGTDPALATVATVSAGTTTAGTTPETVSSQISGLTPGTVYYFRVTGVNASNAQTQRGAILSFTPSALTGQEVWRQQWFGTTANTGDAADAADPDQDGLVNLVEYGFGLNPTSAASNVLPMPHLDGGNLEITFDRPPSATGVRYDAEWSPTLNGDWTPVDDTGIEPHHIFSVPVGTNVKLFMRLKVSVVD
jgi:uncharacterized repeat protein (TIGR03803 family)